MEIREVGNYVVDLQKLVQTLVTNIHSYLAKYKSIALLNAPCMRKIPLML